MEPAKPEISMGLISLMQIGTMVELSPVTKPKKVKRDKQQREEKEKGTRNESGNDQNRQNFKQAETGSGDANEISDYEGISSTVEFEEISAEKRTDDGACGGGGLDKSEDD